MLDQLLSSIDFGTLLHQYLSRSQWVSRWYAAQNGNPSGKSAIDLRSLTEMSCIIMMRLNRGGDRSRGEKAIVYWWG